MADKSDTPRVDKVFAKWAKGGSGWVVRSIGEDNDDPWELARTLERELAAAQSAKEELLVALREVFERLDEEPPEDDANERMKRRIVALLTKHGA